MPKPLIRVVNVKRDFQMDGVCVHALKNINLEIQNGEYLAITGTSGSGKSTLMHILGLLDKPTEGKIYLQSKEISRLNSNQLAEIRNKTIGFVFQTFNLLARTTALENVEMPMIYAGVPGGKRKAIAAKRLTQLGLGNRLKHQPNQLSGGQQQRVAIARALVNNPQIILADEPTGNLDSKSGRDIMKVLANLHRQKHTIILVTHDMYLAKEARRQIILKDGEIIKDTTEVKHKLEVLNNNS